MQAGLFALALIRCGSSFEIFSEQQIVTLNNPGDFLYSVDFNNSILGSTHIDDYWAKVDLDYSPLPGWSNSRHVHIGCFSVVFETPQGDITYSSTSSEDMTDLLCVTSCNFSQAYYQHPECRCATMEDKISMTVLSTCSEAAWQVYRQYDYRTSMAPSTFDVSTRLLYQIVSLRIPTAHSPVEYYIHAVNAMEARPAFEYDTKLDRMIFNAIWDFGKGRLVALSFSKALEVWDGTSDFTLDFTVIVFNKSTGTLKVTQDHYTIQDQISSQGSLLSVDGLFKMTSVDGLCAVDILYGTYYTVVPAVLPTSPQVVHVVVAIDINAHKVINSVTLPVTLMNMQINALQHVLYGAGAVENEQEGQQSTYWYYKICQAANVTQNADGLTRVGITVSCDMNLMGELPSSVEYMYLQSATLDHRANYAWFAYKNEVLGGGGRPLIMEYHHDAKEFIAWKQESLPMDAAYTSFVNTAPRIIYSLFPPLIRSAKFSASGTKIFVQFDSATLQGALPIDRNGDEIPDYYNPADAITRGPCERFLDDFTMKLIPGSMCQWTDNANFFIEINLQATIAPGDMVRVRPGKIYAGTVSLGGVYQFSQSSTDFGIVQPPDVIPVPTVQIVSPEYVDTCTDVLLDGTQSTDHGYRGTFIWSLNFTDPVTSEPHLQEMRRILREDTFMSPQAILIPKGSLQGNVSYHFNLKVISFWNKSISATQSRVLVVSLFPVPALGISSAVYRKVPNTEDFTVTTDVDLNAGCMVTDNPKVEYVWAGCFKDDAVKSELGLMGCPRLAPDGPWSATAFTLPGPLNVSGIYSKTLLVKGRTLTLFKTYMFTVFIFVQNENQESVFRNQASATVEGGLTDMELYFVDGTQFTAPTNEAVVWNVYGRDESDPENKFGDPPNFSFSCEVGATRRPCDELFDFTRSFPPSPAGPTTAPTPAPTPGGGTEETGRRLPATSKVPVFYEPEPLNTTPCVPVMDDITNMALKFIFRGNFYDEALGISWPLLNTASEQLTPSRFCVENQSKFVIQRYAFPPGEYRFNVNMTKRTFDGTIRQASGFVSIMITEEQFRNTVVAITKYGAGSVKPSDVLRFYGWVTNPKNDTQYTYTWSAFKYTSNADYDGEVAGNDPNYNVSRFRWNPVPATELNFSSDLDLRTPPNDQHLVLAPFVLQPNVFYKIRVTAVDFKMDNAGMGPLAQGYAEEHFYTTGLPPSGGQILATVLTGTAFLTQYTFTLVGFGSDDIPITYMFGYKQNANDPIEEVRYLTSSYSAQNTITTVLPPGLTIPSNRVQVLGFARSSLGQVSVVTTQVAVAQPEKDTGRLALVDSLPRVDPETSLIRGIMLTDSTLPASVEELGTIFEAVINTSTLRTANTSESGLNQIFTASNGAGFPVPLTKEIVSQYACFIAGVALKGLKTDAVLAIMQVLFNLASSMAFIDADDALAEGRTDVSKYLLVMADSFTPGLPAGRRLRYMQVAEERALAHPAARSLGAAYARALAADPPETRPPETQYIQFEKARDIARDVVTLLVRPLFPGEIPIGRFLRSQDMYVGKSTGVPDGDAHMHNQVLESFTIPTLYEPDSNLTIPVGVYIFRYVQFKKFPFGYLNLPEKRDLDPPPVNYSDAANKVPDQKYSIEDKYWAAMSMELTDENGGSLEEAVITSLANASFNGLPKLAAYYLATPNTTIYAATCFYVANESGGNFSHVRFDTTGVTYAEESCVTSHLSDFVVFVDDLLQDLAITENPSRESNDAVTEDPVAAASVSGFVIIAIFAVLGAGAGHYYDQIDASDVIDMRDLKVEDDENKRQRVQKTMTLTFKRSHLIVGGFALHRKVDRPWRVSIALVAWVSIQAIATMLHSKFEIRAQNEFVATGLVSGILVFPLVQFMIFLIENQPRSKVLPAPPPRANVPREIPLHAPIAKVKQAMLPPVPPSHGFGPGGKAKAPPPQPFEVQRLALADNLRLPVVPPPPPDQAGKMLVKPPKAPPKLAPKKPTPPTTPPPLNHLTAMRKPTVVPPLLRLPMPGSSNLALPPVPPGTYGLSIPMIRQMPLRVAETTIGKQPPRPPVVPTGGPRPPRAPPPQSKMFFSVSKDAKLALPPVPSLPARSAGLPKLPALPQLSPLRFEADGLNRPIPKPPPALPKAKPGGPLIDPPPDTPRSPRGEEEENELYGFPSHRRRERLEDSTPTSSSLPPVGTLGFTLNSAVSEDSPPSRSAPRLDAQRSPSPRRKLFPDPKHGAPPPSARLGGPGQWDPYLHGDGSDVVGSNGLPPLPALPAIAGTSAAAGALALWKRPPAVLSRPVAGAGIGELPPAGPPPQRMTALPLPSTILMKVPNIKPHAGGLLPPPPPPALPSWVMLPPPPSKLEGPVKALQTLKALEGIRVRPKPPDHRPDKVPAKPPSTPPPAHALQLSRGPSSPSSGGGKPSERAGKEPRYLDGRIVRGVNNLAEVAARAKPPPSLPKPPPGGAPTFVHKSTLPAEIAASRISKVPHGTWSTQAARPVEDWVVSLTTWCIRIFGVTVFFSSCFLITVFGTYLETDEWWATLGATVIGCFVNLVVFESVKCVVIAMVLLVADDTEKKVRDTLARRARMQMKAQRLKSEGKWSDFYELPKLEAYVPPLFGG